MEWVRLYIIVLILWLVLAVVIESSARTILRGWSKPVMIGWRVWLLVCLLWPLTLVAWALCVPWSIARGWAGSSQTGGRLREVK